MLILGSKDYANKLVYAIIAIIAIDVAQRSMHFLILILDSLNYILQ